MMERCEAKVKVGDQWDDLAPLVDRQEVAVSSNVVGLQPAREKVGFQANQTLRNPLQSAQQGGESSLSTCSDATLGAIPLKRVKEF